MKLRPCRCIGALLLLAACSSKPGAPTQQSGTSGLPDITNVIYVGGASDDSLLHLLAVTARDEAQKYVIIDAPDLSVPLSSASPAAFAFHLASPYAFAPSPSVKPTPRERPPWPRSVPELLRVLGPERVAYAHGIPYNGTAYFFVISDADAKPLLRLFTAQASYTADAATWQSMASAPQPLSLTITSAFFEENDIPEDGGPFVGGSFSFRIQ